MCYKLAGETWTPVLNTGMKDGGLLEVSAGPKAVTWNPDVRTGDVATFNFSDGVFWRPGDGLEFVPESASCEEANTQAADR